MKILAMVTHFSA